MTFTELVMNYCMNYGMDEYAAHGVLQTVMYADGAESMADIWLEQVDEYDESMSRLIIALTKECALEWIDSNAPLAWYRRLFE